jgi:subtilisin family serine protease
MLMLNQGAFGARLSESIEIKIASGDSRVISAVVFLEVDPERKIALSKTLKSIPRSSDRYSVAYSSIVSGTRRSVEEFSRQLDNSGLDIEIEKSFKISKAILVQGTPAAIARLSELESVHYVVEDTVLELIAPVDVAEASSSSGGGAESNLIAIKADRLWQMGYTGQGRFVLSFDTGVDGAHSGLSARWRGTTSGNPEAGWFDPYGTSVPEDGNGHGTHVMGIMAGVLDGDTVGVAPDVEWGCAAVIDRGSGFTKTISDILDAFDWAANPDGDPETTADVPDAINHSWGVPTGVFEACDNTFWQAIDNLEELGIVNIFACGNEGPNPNTIRNPADRVSSPLNSFSVGAVDHNNSSYPVASFSSRGPANCDSTQIKPEIVAPGVAIKSLRAGGGFKLMSGTSMAAPQVAGAVALLRQYNPDATAEQIKHALLMSAEDIGDPGEDNATGFGLIDLESALDYMPIPSHALIMYRGFEIVDDGDEVIELEETVEMLVDIEIRNYDVEGLWGILGTYNQGISILSDSAYFGTLSAGENLTNDSQPFVVTALSSITPGERVTFRLDFYNDAGDFMNNVYFEVVVGQSQQAASTTIENEQLAVGVCNYGVIGLGEGSLIDMGEAGFTVDSSNYLAEFALLIADDQGRVSDAARDASGQRSDNDFLADENSSLDIYTVGQMGDLEAVGSFSDGLAEDPIGLDITQDVQMFSDSDLQTALLVKYLITVQDGFAGLTICPGIIVDVDFPVEVSITEYIGFDESRNLSYFYETTTDRHMGIGLVSGPSYSFAFLSNPMDSNVGLSDSVKSAAVWSGVIAEPLPKSADFVTILSALPVSLSGGESTEVAFVIVWASSWSELLQKYDRAYGLYNSPTSADDDRPSSLPSGFTLSQNYPNPFNPSTSIMFSVDREQHVALTIYNVLGQHVRTLVDGAVTAGFHDVVWDATDESGNSVASGIYFYRLDTGESHTTRKMMLLK